MTRKSWKEFQESKLLWWVNRSLHLFGWALVAEADDDGNITEVYPARVSFRGFSQESEELGFAGLTHYLSAEIEDLVCETVMPTEADDDDNLWDSPAAVALTEAMHIDSIRKDITIGRRLGENDFAPRYWAKYKDEELFCFSCEIFQDIKFHELISFNGGKVLRGGDVRAEIISHLIAEKPQFKDHIIIALEMIMSEMRN